MEFVIHEGEHFVLPLGWYDIEFIIPAGTSGRYFDGIFLVEEHPPERMGAALAILDEADMASFLRTRLPWSWQGCQMNLAPTGVLRLKKMKTSVEGVHLPDPLDLDEL